MRKQIAAANWKMNLTVQQAGALTDELMNAGLQLGTYQEVILGVPFPYLSLVRGKLGDTPQFYVAAQNCHTQKSGAYTGEVSVDMLQSLEISHVILGHSERREYFNESPKMLADKVDICLASGLKQVFCCGEPLAIRESGTENAYVEAQLRESLFHLGVEQLTGFIIAYEPIWAIGTGKTATNEQAQQMHAHIRQVMRNQYGEALANSISILYGGSVKAGNAAEIFAQPDVDGGLVGGASLVAVDFTAIIRGLKK
ncbi:MAG: triose-phosphate isomerase [Chitinophagaceae bacterium]|nr:triose-phosphate isomerase [Chitinophagaceae bacterium]